MRGGAIPFVVWGTLNLTLLVINWIWEGTGIHVGLFGYCVLVIYLSGMVLLLAHRQAIRKGPPEYMGTPEALPRVSFASAGVGISIGVALFGVVFGKFLIFIGGALLLASLWRLVQELAWQRQTLRGVRGRRRS